MITNILIKLFNNRFQQFFRTVHIRRGRRSIIPFISYGSIGHPFRGPSPPFPVNLIFRSQYFPSFLGVAEGTEKVGVGDDLITDMQAVSVCGVKVTYRYGLEYLYWNKTYQLVVLC